MDPRIFTQTTVAWTSDGKPETFARGERIKNIIKIGRGVTFEAVDPHRITSTYTMDWEAFVGNTVAVSEAKA